MPASQGSSPSYARDESVRNVFAALGIPPEELAYTMAAYSRSRRSFLETNAYITSQKAKNFLETFYFAYGHKSIADMAHVPFAIENISILAAIEVVFEQLWDGQERSTRYQDFTVTGYCVPDEVRGSEAEEAYRKAADGLFEAYEEISRLAFAHYRETTPKPDVLDAKEYERTLRARAFDVARYCLPLATNTSVGQITSARTLEAQISRLMTSPFGEVRRIGHALKKAGDRPAKNPVAEELHRELGSVLERVREVEQSSNDPTLREIAQTIEKLQTRVAPVPAAPTLVKYTAPLDYRREVVNAFTRVYHGLLGKVPVEHAPAVTLVEVEDPTVEAVAKLLYGIGVHPFRQLVRHVQTLSPDERRQLLDLAFERRGPHDPWPPELRIGYLNFDIVMDIGSFRDLHRHRRCQQIRQPYTIGLGYETPEVLKACGAASVYEAAVQKAFSARDEVDASAAPCGAYVLPLGTRCRTLFSMDLAELAYITELRTRPTGHFSYRRIAYEMYRQTVRRYPDFEPYIRAVDPEYENLMER